MPPEESTQTPSVQPSRFSASDIIAVLRERNWLAGELSPQLQSWCERAAALLGAHTADQDALTELLGLVFHYHAPEILSRVQSHAVLSRYGARDVLRQLTLQLLDGVPLTSDRFKEIINRLKEEMNLRGRDLFYPLRLALAGRVGEGDLDRVILLLDDAAALSFYPPVKSARTRIIEFCSSLD